MRDIDTGQRTTEPTLLDDTARQRREALMDLVKMSRVIPQMGIYDPANIVIPSAEDKAIITKTPAQTPEAAQPEDSQATLEDAAQFKRDLLAAQLIGEMGSIVSLPSEMLAKIFPITDLQKSE